MADVKPKPDTGFRQAKIPAGKDTSLFGGAPPPPPPKKAGSKYEKYAAWAKKNGVSGSTATDIYYWSQHTPNVDPYLFTAVLLRESGAKHLGGNGNIKSSGQAVGIAQVALSWIGQPIPWDRTHKFTGDNNTKTGVGNYGVNLRMGAYLWGEAVGQVGWEKAYTDPQYGYNPNDPHKDQAWADIQKTYQSRPAGTPAITSPSQGPADTTQSGQQGSTINPPTFQDPYITGINKQGKFSTTNDPNKAMQYNGRPLTRSNFLGLKDSLTSFYVSYTGGRPSDSQIQNYIVNGWNTYTLTALLSQGKKFGNSPIYKEFVGNWQNDPSIKDALGGGKIPPDIARQAILNHWNSSTILTKVRALPTYSSSNEFKGNVATMLNVHSSIMGTPDAKAMVAIKDAAIQGWKPDQYAAWLRSQPEYSRSPEYQTKALSILSGLGLITGDRPILAKGVGPGPGAVQPNLQALPADKRIPGNPKDQNAPLPGLGATLSRA